MDDGFGHWLAGFIDGEGCFSIVPHDGRVSCRFAIELRADDKMILVEIARRVRVGQVVDKRVRARDRPGTRPQAVWKVQDRAGCAAMVELLDRFPLRSKKARDYVIWREAIAEWQRLATTPRARFHHAGTAPHDWTRMLQLADALRETRAYERGLIAVA